MGIKKEENLTVKYDIQLTCPICGDINMVEYILGLKEQFECKKCKQKNNVVMSFLAIVDNPPGVRTMMVRPPEKRKVNKKIGGVVSPEKQSVGG